MRRSSDDGGGRELSLNAPGNLIAAVAARSSRLNGRLPPGASTCRPILKYFHSARGGGKALQIRTRNLSMAKSLVSFDFEYISGSGSPSVAQWLPPRVRFSGPESRLRGGLAPVLA